MHCQILNGKKQNGMMGKVSNVQRWTTCAAWDDPLPCANQTSSKPKFPGATLDLCNVSY